jgi:hypothetical protein
VVDGVLQLLLVAMTPRSDSLSSGVSHSIATRRSEGWLLVPADNPGPREDLCDGIEFYLP